MRSITTFDLQYAHRFYGFQGEAQYLHGHTGKLTIEVEDSIEAGVNMVYPCNEIQKVAWDVLRNFDHALVLREDDPLLPAVYDLLKDKLNIAKITFTSGVNAASAEFVTKNDIDRCPLCGVALNEEGVCPKCGYRKKK